MKKIILTEADKKQIIIDREKLIIENFSKTFNKIKRLDENFINEKEELSQEEQQVLDDILNSANNINESGFDSMLEKIKGYVKKGMMTAGILASLLSTPGMAAAQQNAIKAAARTEMPSQQQQQSGIDISKMSNVELTNYVVRLIKQDNKKAESWSKIGNNGNSMVSTIYGFVKTGYGENAKDANTFGGYLKNEKNLAFTKDFINHMKGSYNPGIGLGTGGPQHHR